MSYVATMRRPFGLGATTPLPTSTAIEEGVGGSLLAAAPLAGPAAPFLAAAGAIAELLGKIGVGAGCGQTCIAASDYANQAEPILQQNIAAYFNLPTPRSTVNQQAALANYESVWNGLVSACSNPSLGSAGQKCISDRQAGACTWKQATTPPWGSPAAGECWNWDNGYREPIANDTNVYTPSASTSAGSMISSAVSSLSSSGWLIPAAAIGLLILGMAVSK